MACLRAVVDLTVLSACSLACHGSMRRRVESVYGSLGSLFVDVWRLYGVKDLACILSMSQWCVRDNGARFWFVGFCCSRTVCTVLLSRIAMMMNLISADDLPVLDKADLVDSSDGVE